MSVCVCVFWAIHVEIERKAKMNESMNGIKKLNFEINVYTNDALCAGKKMNILGMIGSSNGRVYARPDPRMG